MNIFVSLMYEFLIIITRTCQTGALAQFTWKS